MTKGILAAAVLSAGLLVAGGARANGGGRATAMPALYDGKPLVINFMQHPPGGQAAVLAHNPNTNNIYQCDACEGLLPGGGDFISVIDAIQNDGFNPLWMEQQITFNEGFAPRQFQSDNDVLDAEAAGEITLTPTGELYVCAVLGPGPKNPASRSGK
jgi:hypothetical protein